MKTQLIQDFEESGSVPAGPAAALPTEPPTEPPTQPRPAVWHRPQAHAQAQGQAHACAPQPPGLGSALAQDATVTDPAAKRQARPPGRPRDTTDVNGDPEWLAALLARDAEELSESQSSVRRTRRLVTWGTAGVLLVLLAAGGLWMYQDSRVEGALVVVASTSPAPATVPARPSLTGAAPALPASPGMPGARALAVPLAPVVPVSGASPPAPPPPHAAPDKPQQELAPDKSRQEAASIPAAKPRRPHVRKRTKADAAAEVPVDAEASARQRQEETLLQCRAHGVDERQCVQRGCEMTRYGFACKG